MSAQKKREMFPTAPWPKRVKTEIEPTTEEPELPIERYWPPEILAQIISEKNDLGLFESSGAISTSARPEISGAIVTHVRKYLETFFGKSEFQGVINKAKEFYPAKWEQYLVRMYHQLKKLRYNAKTIIYCTNAAGIVRVPRQNYYVSHLYDAVLWKDLVRAVVCDPEMHRLILTESTIGLSTRVFAPHEQIGLANFENSHLYTGNVIGCVDTFHLFSVCPGAQFFVPGERTEIATSAVLNYPGNDLDEEELEAAVTDLDIQDEDLDIFQLFATLIQAYLFDKMAKSWADTRVLLEQNDDQKGYLVRPCWYGDHNWHGLSLIESRARAKFIAAWNSFLCSGETHVELVARAAQMMVCKATVTPAENREHEDDPEYDTRLEPYLKVEHANLLADWTDKVREDVTDYIIKEHDKALETFIETYATIRLRLREVDLSGKFVPL